MINQRIVKIGHQDKLFKKMNKKRGGSLFASC